MDPGMSTDEVLSPQRGSDKRIKETPSHGIVQDQGEPEPEPPPSDDEILKPEKQHEQEPTQRYPLKE
jgi:hypothetical protein